MILTSNQSNNKNRSYPRVSGGDPGDAAAEQGGDPLSPRERG